MVFAKMTINDWSKIFGPVHQEHSVPRVYDLQITLPLQTVTSICQRRWLCVNGRFERTSERRIEEAVHPLDPEQVVSYNGPSPEANELIRTANNAVSKWKAALEADKKRRAFAEACSSGG